MRSGTPNASGRPQSCDPLTSSKTDGLANADGGYSGEPPFAHSSLDPLQTSVAPAEIVNPEYPPAPSDPSAIFIHSGWAPVRSRVREAMIATARPVSRVERFDQCGSDAYVWVNKENPEDVTLTRNWCGDRLCTPCANARSFKIAQRVITLVGDRRIKLLTLTIMGKDEPLRPLVDRLYRHFRQLRDSDFWSENVLGGCAFLEIKWSDKAQRWHPHLHILLESNYLEQGFLTKLWHAISRDSYIVDIRAVHGNSTVTGYVTKYASKPLNPSFSNSPDLLQEAMLALAGRRLCLTFGSWYGTRLTNAEDEELYDEAEVLQCWSCIGSLRSVLSDAAIGDSKATRLIQLLTNRQRARPRSPPNREH